ncbi:hypothetical protein BC829DRAFT_432728 [Chytridium lagenaria]|nr:hypothetical protein BC829DRAFT_432728 [Chytridium lagenaria]
MLTSTLVACAAAAVVCLQGMHVNAAPAPAPIPAPMPAALNHNNNNMNHLEKRQIIRTLSSILGAVVSNTVNSPRTSAPAATSPSFPPVQTGIEITVETAPVDAPVTTALIPAQTIDAPVDAVTSAPQGILTSQPRTTLINNNNNPQTTSGTSATDTSDASNPSSQNTQGASSDSALSKGYVIALCIIAASALGLVVASWIFRKTLCRASRDFQSRRFGTVARPNSPTKKGASPLSRELDDDDIFGGRLEKRRLAQEAAANNAAMAVPVGAVSSMSVTGAPPPRSPTPLDGQQMMYYGNGGEMYPAAHIPGHGPPPSQVGMYAQPQPQQYMGYPSH